MLVEEGLTFNHFALVGNIFFCSHGNSYRTALSTAWPLEPPFYIFEQKSSSTQLKTEIVLDLMGTLGTHPNDVISSLISKNTRNYQISAKSWT